MMFIRSIAVCMIALFAATGAHAASYPSQSIKILVPFAPGGPTDLVARILADHISKVSGQAAVVENVPGAGGIVGTERVARAAPDGYTILMGSSGALSVAPSINPNLGYDPGKDFTPISLATRAPSYLVVNDTLQVNSVDELIAHAKKNPGKLSYSSAGSGTSQHTNMELLKSMAGISVVHIPYRGGGPSGLAIISGEVNMAMETGPVVFPHATSGKLKILAASTAQRTKSMPDVPTLDELGLKGFDASTWFGLVGPANLPRPIVDTLNKYLAEALAPEDVRKKLLDLGAEVATNSPEEFAAFQKNEIQKWAAVMKNVGDQDKK